MSDTDTLGTDAPTDSADFQERAAHYEALVDTMEGRAAEIRKGGGEKKIQKQHDRGKLTVRERIEYLLDDPDQFAELGLFAGYEMYEEEGGCPAGGTVMGFGPVNGRGGLVVANDATVKAGAWFPITAKKNLRAQDCSYRYQLVRVSWRTRIHGLLLWHRSVYIVRSPQERSSDAQR